MPAVRRALLVCALTALGGCGVFSLELTNAPGVPDCTPGRAQCR
jgi:hypothetical protein